MSTENQIADFFSISYKKYLLKGFSKSFRKRIQCYLLAFCYFLVIEFHDTAKRWRVLGLVGSGSHLYILQIMWVF